MYFNIASDQPILIEEVADAMLIPYQYAFMGKRAILRENGAWQLEMRFDYEEHFWMKNLPSFALAPASLFVGGVLKSLAYLSPDVRARYQRISAPFLQSNFDRYRRMGLFGDFPIAKERFTCLNYARQPGDESHLQEEKEVLEEIGKAFERAGILWWVDCGTCLGAYRYGGVIPWDFDVDIAVLQPDFQNVYNALKWLDQEKYAVVDLSARGRPMSLIKIFLRKDPTKVIDIYHFRIDAENRLLHFVLSQEDLIFLPDAWRERERPFKTPVRFEDVFPLKRAYFDGIDIFVPNNPEKYLSRVYGKDLTPVKLYNDATCQYEKDFSHPYWESSHVH